MSDRNQSIDCRPTLQLQMQSLQLIEEPRCKEMPLKAETSDAAEVSSWMDVCCSLNDVRGCLREFDWEG
jgi:hypothetical protein